jgi:regulation of enolase protein 1 (concanavalin A-like superfamily)
MTDVCFLLYKSRYATRVAACLLLIAIASVNPLSAQTVPSPWAARDIGSPGIAGSATASSGKFTVEAAGADIWGTSDQFHFVYQQMTGDAEVIARVDSITRADAWSKAGVMIRGSLSSGSAHAFALVSSGNGVAFQRRTAAGGASTHTSGPAVSAPRWVRLVRTGTTVTASTSADGQAWTTIGSDTIALGSAAYVGLAVTSHNSNLLTTAALSQVRVAVPAPSSSTVPAPLKASDIGSPAIRGTVSYNSGTYTVNAAGVDIWNTSDQFHYIYQQVTGDVDVTVQVQSVSQAHSWSKTGVMIRESLSPGSRHAFALLSAARGYAFHRRLDPNGFTLGGAGVTGAAPGWVRLVRSGSRIEAFRSSNGTSWISMGSEVVPMVQTVYVGIATTSHDSGRTTRAVLNSFKVTANGTTPANQPPTVSLTAPASGATYAAPASMAVSASAADSDGTIAKVEFYAGATLLAADTTAPYSYTWSSVPAGTYSLTAVAYDNSGARVTSAARSITVSGTPTPTPAPTTVVFHASVDHSTVTSYRLDVFASGANPATATAVVSSDLGKGTPDANGDITVNRSAVFSALAAGSYQATVTAIGAGGSSRSAAVAFTR